MIFKKIPILLWFLMLTLLILGFGIWFFSNNVSKVNKEDSSKPLPVSKNVENVEEYKIISREHITQGSKGSGYNSNPPTSGMHWVSPAKNGIFENSLQDEQVIHNLEHGYIWITYKTNTNQEIQNQLRKIIEQDNSKIILSPREANDRQIILAAWGRTLKMDEPNSDAIKNFIKTYRNRGPESTPE